MKQVDFLALVMTPYQRSMMAARGLIRHYVLRTSSKPVGLILHEYEREAERAQRLAVREPAQ